MPPPYGGMPGLVNTHHHMYQSLTRAMPDVQNAELFTWLSGLYPLWAGLTPEMVHVSTQLAMAELLVSGGGAHGTSDHAGAGAAGGAPQPLGPAAGATSCRVTMLA